MSVSIHIIQAGETSSIATAGDYTIKIDRPESKGGNDEGPMGGQVLLMGIGGCFASTLIGAAKSRGWEVKGLEIALEAFISETSPKRFDKIVLQVVNGTCSEDDVFDKLIAIAEKGCIAVNTVKPGLDIQVLNKIPV